MEQTDKPAPRKRKQSPSGSPTPRQILHEKRAALALQGMTYEQIHAEIGKGKPTKYPRQTVYNSIQSKGGQKALAKVASEFYDEAKLKRKLNELLDKPKTRDGDRIRAIELAMRSLAMLTDKQVRDVTTREERDLSQVPDHELHKALLDRIKDSQANDTQGVAGN